MDGPYSPFAAGQPTGTLYLASVSTWIFGSTIFAIRLVPAVAGILTVVALFAYGRRNFGSCTAALAAAMLAFSSWHIGISRLAIPLAAWPLVGLLTAGALCEALRATRPGPADRSVALVGARRGRRTRRLRLRRQHLLRTRTRSLPRRRRDRTPAGTSPAAGGSSGDGDRFCRRCRGMIRYAAGNPDGYLGHARYASIFNKPQWTSLHGIAAKTEFLARRYIEYWDRLCCHPEIDIDRNGLAPPATSLLPGVGRVRNAARALEAPQWSPWRSASRWFC